jgi:predicted nucleotide-binding protein
VSAKRYANTLKGILEEKLSPQVYTVSCWFDKGIFELSKSTIENLITSFNQIKVENGYVIALMNSDDKVTLQKQSGKSILATITRDNVIFELGLAYGILDSNHTFFIKPRTDGFHIPSDLNGVTFAKYDSIDVYAEVAKGIYTSELNDAIKWDLTNNVVDVLVHEILK